MANQFNQIEKMLRHRLKTRKSRKYLQWIAENKDVRKHGHHILGSTTALKLNDYLIAKVDPQAHLNRRTDFAEDLLDALENLFDYVEYLEGNK